ncbi:MAG: dynamin family protein [Candidatus Marinimicrobia bacterium]|nr:dynamin family protein [Candidatus Neomarinimicrobiota bacterium]
MSKIFKYRTQLKSLLKDHINFAKEIPLDSKELEMSIASLDQGELSVAVVGEVNRGKSTFLNALIGARVFPSRASVCTAGVTILDNGNPHAEIYFKNGKVEKIDLDGKEPEHELEKLVSRKNINVKNINMVRVWYPNEFTGNGIILVDTPGVNDPETWREEITYSYLASADAVIMLLDPMQPISESEVEFLDKKILSQSIANLIFIINRIDDVSFQDRKEAEKRIDERLSQYVPNPDIHLVASKPALQAKLTSDATSLNATGFPDFERKLLGFLEKGRGGLLLRSKVQKGLDHLESINSSLAQRMGALNSEKDIVIGKLKESQKTLGNFENRRRALEKSIKAKENKVKEDIKRIIEDREQYLNSSLKPALQNEPDINVLRNNILTFQRDTIQSFKQSVQSEFDSILEEFGVSSIILGNEIKGILNNLTSEVSNSVNAIQIHRKYRSVDTVMNDRKAGAAIGGGLGAVAGAAIASNVTATTITAAGTLATTAAFGTAGIIGIGILTGGIGLLLGLGAAALMDEKSNQQRSHRSYIDSSEMVNNQRALLAVDRFLNNLHSAGRRMSKIINQTAIGEIVEPVNLKLKQQKTVIDQIQTDLSKTTEDQASTREFLTRMIDSSKLLQIRYNSIMEEIS